MAKQVYWLSDASVVITQPMRGDRVVEFGIILFGLPPVALTVAALFLFGGG